MFRSLGLYGVSEARRCSNLIAATTSKPRPILGLLHLQLLPVLPDVYSKNQQGSSRQQTATHQYLAGLISTLVSIQVKCIGTVSGSSKHDSSSVSHSHQHNSRNAAESSAIQPTQSKGSIQAGGGTHGHSGSKLGRQDKAQQVTQVMGMALKGRDYESVKRLFDPQLANQARFLYSVSTACIKDACRCLL